MTKILIDEALRLAEYLELPHIGQNKSAAELRRLHAENQALRQTLEQSEAAMRRALESLEHLAGAMPFPVGTQAIAALRQALAEAALDKMAENARELGLSYEQSAPPCKYGNKPASCTSSTMDCQCALDAVFEQPAPAQEPVALEEYDAGLLNDFGGGNVEWWQDYMRTELGRAYEYYQSQMPALPAPAHCEAGPEHCPQCKAEQPAPAQEPVAKVAAKEGAEWWQSEVEGYATPPAPAQALTDEQIDDIWNAYCDEMGYVSINDAYDIARAIEAAHGITSGEATKKGGAA